MKGITMEETQPAAPAPESEGVKSPGNGGPQEARPAVPLPAPGTQALTGKKIKRNRFEPLTVELIEEGEFLNSVNEEVRETVRYLIAMKRKYGAQAMKKMKGVVNCKLTIQFDGADDSDFSIKTAFTKSLPTRPAHVTKAIQGTEQDGSDTLLVRPSGSTSDDPRQTVLCTKDGKAVNPETGEIL